MTGEVKWADVPDPHAESFGGNESRCQLSDGPKPAAGNQTCESRSSLSWFVQKVTLKLWSCYHYWTFTDILGETN